MVTEMESQQFLPLHNMSPHVAWIWALVTIVPLFGSIIFDFFMQILVNYSRFIIFTGK